MNSSTEHEAIVIYVHHKNDYVTQKHLELLRKHNDFPVIPIFCRDGGVCDPVEGAQEVQKPYKIGDNWHNMDLLCRQWFIENPDTVAKRYIWIESDCRVNKPLIECYREAWNADFAAYHILYPSTSSHWELWDQYRHLIPERLYPFITGAAPVNASLLSRKAMQAFADAEILEGVFSEIRFPTVIRSAGFQLSSITPSPDSQNIYLGDDRSVEITGDGIQHPVKSYKYVPNR